jgi:hypothetical protein
LVIHSNYRGMASGLVADHLGFMFQDRGEIFSLNANAANVTSIGAPRGAGIPIRYVTMSDATCLTKIVRMMKALYPEDEPVNRQGPQAGRAPARSLFHAIAIAN